MSIILRGCARVRIPEDQKQEVLGIYLHYHRDGSYIRNYKYADGYAYLPPNARKLAYVAKLLNENIDDQRSPGVNPSSEFVLNPTFRFREHQTKPSTELLTLCQGGEYCILRAGCGNGKTVVMTWVAGQLQRRVLILVDMGSLQSQWQEAFKMVWDREAQVINRDTKVFGDVCIATFQLLHANPEMVILLRETFGTLLLDEFHSTGSNTRREILFKMNNLNRIGCTATLMKKGYSDDVLTDFVSSTYVEMKDEKAMKPDVNFIETGVPFYSDNPDDWGKIQSQLGKNVKRNKLMAAITLEQLKLGRVVLVIGITVESLKYIEAELLKVNKELCKVKVYTGSTTLKQDLKLKDDLVSGLLNCVLTVKKADKGLDLPPLDCLILGKPANNEAFIIQIAGRIVRFLAGKPIPVIFDLVDSSNLALTFARNRRKWYRKLGYRIVEDISDSFK